MSLDSVPDCGGISYVDVEMFGMEQVNSPYIIDSPQPAIVDTGPANATEPILAGLDELDIAPESVSYIIPTHAHLDHAGSAGYLAEACENATVVCHERGIEYLTDETKLTRLTESVERAIGMPEPYGEPTVIDPERCLAVSGGETLDLGDRTLELIDAPGHAPHQCCLYDTKTAALFSGDASGMQFPDVGHRPTTPPPNFDLEYALSTLDRLAEFEPETVCYAHFGPGEPGNGTREIQTYREMLPSYVEQIDSLREQHDDDTVAIAREMNDEWGHWSLEIDIGGILRYLEA